jgi:hypothetical protein
MSACGGATGGDGGGMTGAGIWVGTGGAEGGFCSFPPLPDHARGSADGSADAFGAGVGVGDGTEFGPGPEIGSTESGGRIEGAVVVGAFVPADRADGRGNPFAAPEGSSAKAAAEKRSGAAMIAATTALLAGYLLLITMFFISVSPPKVICPRLQHPPS